MKIFLYLSSIILLLLTGCTISSNTTSPTPFLKPIDESSTTLTITPVSTLQPTSTTRPTMSPQKEALSPGKVEEHPATTTNPYFFYTYFPKSALYKTDITVAVYPHGSSKGPSEDYEDFKETAKNSILMLKPFAEEYGLPFLVVAVPRSKQIEAQTLHPATFTTTNEMYRRPDLKLIDAVWNQYIPQLREADYSVNEKVLMLGFSSPGQFTHRFIMFHPELVIAAWEGSEASAPLPTSMLNGTPCDYPLGVKNFEELTGTPFDLEAYKKIPQFITVGDQDLKPNNDPINQWVFPGWHTDFIKSNFGNNTPERNRFYYEYLVSIGADAEFKMYEGIGHEITDQMFHDVFEFLLSHME
ncbi:MAG: hypothetical protein AB9891_07460 [Anaerolineaceae bacterium]